MANRASTSVPIREFIAPSPPQGLALTTPPSLQSYNVKLPKEMGIDPPTGSSTGSYRSFTFDDISPFQWRIRIHKFYL